MDDSRACEIELKVCHTEGPPALEVLEAVSLGPHRYRLLYSPGMVEGIAKGDVIELSDADPKGFSRISRSGNLCVWFYFAEHGKNQGPDGYKVRDAVEHFGGVCDGGGNSHLVFSIPVSLGFPAIEDLFHGLAAQFPGSSWLFGNVYNPWDNFKPLGWWE